MIAIKTQNLCKKYGEKIVVNNLNLEIEQDSLFALLGSNGAGKTTTIKMLSCLCLPSSGSATLLTNDIKTNEKQIKQLINVSPQETAIALNLTVKENLELMARIYGNTKQQAKNLANEYLEKFKLTERKNDRAKKLSGGMKRKLSIAMALISDPKILFLDEPTLGLDVRARRDLWAIIEQLKKKMTIILTTHYMEEAEFLADTIAIMHDGNLIDTGSLATLKKKYKKKNLEEIFLSLTESEVQYEI